MIIFIVGTYKSGTSFVTSLVEEMGVPTCVEEFRQNTSVVGNKHVYNILESYEVNLLNNEIIRSTGQNEMYFETEKMPYTIPEKFINQIKNIYKRTNYNCVIKDPRFIGTLHYWITALGGNPYKIIYVHRNSVTDVVNSFKKDNWFVNKVSGPYEDVVKNLNLNLSKMIEKGYLGLHLNYEFIRKYKQRVYMLMYNYISETFKGHDYKKIYFSEYYKSSSDITKLFSKQCPHGIATWNNLIAVDTQHESDYVIIQDKTKDIIKNKNKVIFFGREPKHVPGGYREWNDTCFIKKHHEWGDFWLPQTWWVDIPYNDLVELDHKKTKNLSVIDSGKLVTKDHKFRLDLINGLRSKYPNDIDIWGKINGNLLPDRDKQKGLLDYKYYLSIENGRTNNYFSEKLCDAILCLCMPIYWGCKKIHEFLPNGSYYLIDDTKPVEQIIDEIINISKSDYREKNIENLKLARNMILEKYNIWPTIESLV